MKSNKAEPRTVMAAPFAIGTTGPGIARGLRDAGWDVVEVDMRHHLPAGPGGSRIARRLARPSRARSYNRDILSSVRLSGADLFLTVKGSLISAASLKELAAKGLPRINYYPDYRLNQSDFNLELANHYDLFVTTKSFQLDLLARQLGEERVAFVHHGYSPLVHRRREPGLREEDYVWDIAYVGSASSAKLDWLDAVARAFPDKAIAIAGPGWQRLAAGTAAERFVINQTVIGDVYARLIERSRISLAVHFGIDPAFGWEDLVSTRTFEIPACGGFMLHIDNAELRTLYDVPAEIDAFTSTTELCDKIAYYLARPDLRRAMIERAHARCVPAYSYSARGLEVANLVRARLISSA